MYVREVEGQVLEFGVSGKLYRNGLIIYDRQSDSEWSHITGVAINGPFDGRQLEPVPSVMAAWAHWKDAHPDTLVLSKNEGLYSFDQYLFDPYDDYYYSGRAGLHGPAERDDRLPIKARLLGVIVNGRAKAYPFEALKEFPVLNDALGGHDLVIATSRIVDRGTGVELDRVTALAYSREVAGQTLTFGEAANPLQQGPLMRDLETGSLWRTLTGEAVDGPMVGRSLNQVPSTTAFWFGWRDYFPETALFDPGGERTPRLG